ncbi:MAG: antitoxin MazE family protein [Proteobacteria bacterium]|nr:antitoxin MazE family protein [Pseudomonadota bacterium]
MAITHVNARVQKHRDALRMAGLRPVQIWVPDTRRPDFAKECRRQSRLAARADGADASTRRFMDEALADVDGWSQ